MTNKYPPIDLNQLNDIIRVVEQISEDPAYIDPSVCEYDDGTLNKLKQLAGWMHPVARATVEEKNPVGRPTKKTALPIDDVELEINEIRKEIGQLKIDAKGMETQDRIQIIKTRAALVEKIIGMKERITNLKQQHKFIMDVMAILEDILDQKQREEVISKLEPYINE